MITSSTSETLCSKKVHLSQTTATSMHPFTKVNGYVLMEKIRLPQLLALHIKDFSKIKNLEVTTDRTHRN